MTKRIIYDLVAFLSVFYAPWWFVVVVGSIGVCMFPKYYEFLFLGLAVDVLYGGVASPMRGTLGIIVATILYLPLSRVREMIR